METMLTTTEKYLMATDVGTTIETLLEKYLADPTSVTQSEVLAAANKTYSMAVKLFEAKEIEQGEISILETNVYNICKAQTEQYQAMSTVNSIWGAAFTSIEMIKNCYMAIKEWFGLYSTTDDEVAYIVQQGRFVLPKYATLLSEMFYTFAEIAAPTLIPTAVGVFAAQTTCALKYQVSEMSVEKSLVSDMLNAAGYAYSGYAAQTDTKPTAENAVTTRTYQQLTTSEVPSKIVGLYNKSNGVLVAGGGLRAWLGWVTEQTETASVQKLIIAFSGTIPTDWNMDYADVLQLSSPSTLYLKAAGLLKIMLDTFSTQKVYVTGHSLGGGLTQFALTANIKGNEDRIKGYAFNPAGLSATSIAFLGSDRLTKSMQNIQVFKTCLDPVSLFGGKLGYVVTLPEGEANSHGMVDLRKCMDVYLAQSSESILQTIKLSLREHLGDDDFVPFTKMLSIQDENGIEYPIFSNAYSTATEYAQIEVPKDLFEAFEFDERVGTECMGVYNKFNGSVHTALNRLLLFNVNGPIVTDHAQGDLQCAVLYGKYGFGIEVALKRLHTLYVESGCAFVYSNQNWDAIVSTLYNPVDLDKEAWCNGIKIQFGYDMEQIFATWPKAEDYFERFLIQLKSDRLDAYHAVYVSGEPTAEIKTSFLNKYKTALVTNATTLLNEACSVGAVTESGKNEVLKTIEDFMDYLIYICAM